MNTTISINVDQYDYNRLMEEHAKNLKVIDDIKKDVCRDCDNINNPVPLFSQLGS
jgi:asparagine synthetase A